ncbi:MAG TPA: XrtA system polysaccharide deacetylase [Caulobacteraceae bacterium]|nr:XrtA system polysaccharide deacetylase [Caulobacteraceae bacterium]
MSELAVQAPTNAFSVDVEDYFQVQSLAAAYPISVWERCVRRVEANTETLLELLDQTGRRGTFFVLGWIAERHPELVRRIADGGHELASHGYRHARVDSQTADEFRLDVRKAKAILEDIAGIPVRGYRAATFSVGPTTPWAWRVLEEEGFTYSSSVYPVKRDLYAFPDAPRKPYRPDGAEQLVEVPIATAKLAGRNWPSGGGGYFRLLPYWVSRAAIARINSDEAGPAVFYIHPWEVDPGQPRARGVPLKSRFRHYTNLSTTRGKLARLLRDFDWDRIDRVFPQVALARESLGAAAE